LPAAPGQMVLRFPGHLGHGESRVHAGPRRGTVDRRRILELPGHGGRAMYSPVSAHELAQFVGGVPPVTPGGDEDPDPALVRPAAQGGLADPQDSAGGADAHKRLACEPLIRSPLLPGPPILLQMVPIQRNLLKSAKYCPILQQNGEARQESTGCAATVPLWHPQPRWYDSVSDVEPGVLGNPGQRGTDGGGVASEAEPCRMHA